MPADASATALPAPSAEAQLSPRMRMLRTINLFVAFIGLGLCMAIPGPTLLDMAQLLHTTTDHMAFIYPARSVGYLVGSLTGGILFDLYSRPLITIIALLVSSIMLITIPLVPYISLLVGNWAICGIGLGCIDTGANVWCLDLWKKESGPYLQALHFCFGIGALVAPILAEPFLSHQPVYLTNATTAGNASVYFDEDDGVIAIPGHLVVNATSPAETCIHHVYMAIGLYFAGSALLFAVACASDPKKDPKLMRKSRSKKDRRLDHNLMTLTAVFISLHSGLEIAFGQFLTTFAVKSELRLSKSEGSYMTSAYWGSYTLFRAVGIVATGVLSNHTMLVADLLVIVAASVLSTVASGVLLSEVGLWVGSCLLGIGIASLFPSTIAYVEEHIEISNRKVSVFLVTVALGEMLIPLCVGSLIDSHPMALMYMSCVCAAACCIVFLLIRHLARKCGNKYKATDDAAPPVGQGAKQKTTDDHAMEQINQPPQKQ